MRETPARISDAARKEVREAFAMYIHEVQDAGMTVRTQQGYLYHVELFMRWLDHDYTPGKRLLRKRLQRR